MDYETENTNDEMIKYSFEEDQDIRFGHTVTFGKYKYY
jgi:hypothetical protein